MMATVDVARIVDMEMESEEAEKLPKDEELSNLRMVPS